MQHYLTAIGDVFEQVKSTMGGLSSDEAAQRLEQNGPNKLREAKKDSLIKRIFQQVKDPMVLILLGAALLSAILAIYEREFPSDMIIILAVVVINSVLGVVQESKAEAAIEALQEMSAATSTVLRDGEILELRSEELVIGDVIMLEAGDSVPADARVFECASMQIEEAALTGESVPVSKVVDMLCSGQNSDIPLGDRKNMVYMGSVVVYGRGKAVVTATGMDTEMGKIADAIAQAEQGLTPLQIKLQQLSKVLTIAVLGVCVFIFGYSVLREILVGDGVVDWGDVLDFFMIAVSLAVAAIPEGLVAVVTIALSIGVTRMSKKKAIIRKLTAVETLGCAQVICSDKTGTLTQNKMTVTEAWAVNESNLATAMALCSDAELQSGGNIIGEPTECALVEWAKAIGLEKTHMKQRMPRIGEAPFDSMRKMMSTVHANEDGSFVQYTKGALDEILQRCSHIFTHEGCVAITQKHRDEILAENKRMANKALRVLAGAQRIHAQAPADFSPAALEQDMCLIGLTGMIDPVRPEVRAAVAECRTAGIATVMITGDHKDTAIAIANELGILTEGKQAITGTELNQISDEVFEKTVGDYAVYARVQPEHKVRIVNAWKKNGCVTAMTGDGVNDAPSIKSADIGVGMGITGTDVTKNVADMVLADDNFATIVHAVGEGRKIYSNIRKVIQFLMSTNVGEVIAVLVATISGFTILKPVHLLWVNLVTDSFPAVALGLEKPEPDVMLRKPRKPSDGVFSGGLGISCLYQGCFIALVTLAAFYIGEFMENGAWQFFNITDNTEGMTMAFLTLNIAEMIHSFNMRSRRGSIITLTRKNGMNWWLVGSFGLALVLTFPLVFIPALREIFHLCQNFTMTHFLICMLLAFSIIPLTEIVKFCQRQREKKL